MKPEEELALSFYRTISVIDEKRGIELTEHIETHRLFLKKRLGRYNLSVFQALKDGNFPGIPRIEFMAEDGENLILIEEFINGENLEQRLEKGCLTEEETAGIIEQLCRILRPLHDHDPRIIHRDIKPSNLILYKDQLWLIDFDAAREVLPGRGRDTVLIGTEDYAAPEQFGFSQSTERTDIYAIGVVMNRLLTGAFPQEKLAGGRLGPVIRRCTGIDPESRYRNVEELAGDIRSRMIGAGTDPDPGARQDAGADEGPGARKGSEQGARNHPGPGARWSPGALFREIPGFRSNKTGRKILAGIGYLLILMTILSLEIKSGNGLPAGPAESVCSKLAALVIIFGMIFYAGNFLGFRDVFPFASRGRIPLEIFRILLGAAIIFIVPFLALALLFPN